MDDGPRSKKTPQALATVIANFCNKIGTSRHFAVAQQSVGFGAKRKWAGRQSRLKQANAT